MPRAGAATRWLLLCQERLRGEGRGVREQSTECAGKEAASITQRIDQEVKELDLALHKEERWEHGTRAKQRPKEQRRWRRRQPGPGW